MRSRSSRGSTSSRNSPVNEASVTVARSEPEPLTHRIRAGRPRKSISSDLAEVLPPPQLQIERSAPSLRERATNCDRVVGVEIFVMALHPSSSNESSPPKQHGKTDLTRRDNRCSQRKRASHAPPFQH